MSTEQPPPSIPPRTRSAQAPVADPARSPAATTSPPEPSPAAPAGRTVTSPETVAGGGTPRDAAVAPDADRSADESVLAGSRARAVAAGGAAAGAVRRVVRGATAAAVAASSGSAAGAAGQGTTTGAGGVPRASHTEGDPTIAATDTAPRTAPARATQSPAPARDAGPRRVRLNLSRVDPWSVMKLSFLLSFAIGIMIVVAAVVVWFALDSLAVFTTINDMLTEIVGEESPIDILRFLDLSRVVSGAFIVAIIDVVLLTALSTIGAFLYNITAALVGGVTVTLTDE